MPVFQVRQMGTKAVVWTGSADGEELALDAMAHAAGFRGRSQLPPNIIDGGLLVEMLNLDLLVTPGRTTGGRSSTAAQITKWLQRAG